MGFNFPNTPSPGDIYQPVGGPSYTWDAQKWVMTGSPLQVTPAYSSRNRIVNGAMQISQENGTTGGSVNGYYPVDQWLAQVVGVAFVANKSSVTAHQIGLQVTTGKVLAAADFLSFAQLIEGARVWDFLYGTANALPSVLRFDVYCPVAGTYGASIRNGVGDRSLVLPFTVSATSVWTTITLPIPGDTAGTWAVDSAAGMIVSVAFACGTTRSTAVTGWQAGNFLAPAGITNGALTTGNVFYLRNVGLYLDPTNSGIPPRWEMPDEAQELLACSRYFGKLPGILVNTGGLTPSLFFKTSMRVLPAVTGGGAGFALLAGGTEFIQASQTTAGYQTLLLNARM